MTLLAPLGRHASRACPAIVDAAYSIAGALPTPREASSIRDAVAPLEELTLEEALVGDALSRHGWHSLAEAIHVAREALRDVLGDEATLEHRGGSHWRAIVDVASERRLPELLADVRAALRRWAPHREHVVVVGAIRAADLDPSARFRELLDPDAADDKVAIVR